MANECISPFSIYFEYFIRERIIPIPDNCLPNRCQVLVYPKAVLQTNPINPDLKGEKVRKQIPNGSSSFHRVKILLYIENKAAIPNRSISFSHVKILHFIDLMLVCICRVSTIYDVLTNVLRRDGASHGAVYRWRCSREHCVLPIGVIDWCQLAGAVKAAGANSEH
ncbi:hypothetical protein Sjap_011320 [Stephania japonica]|uniref:Uncharacterized protein n=1 Tax=Stephania japonica TaxID=461633 RepID=A0AAP0JDA7_9MAGN